MRNEKVAEPFGDADLRMLSLPVELIFNRHTTRYNVKKQDKSVYA
jgi:hypothetical protein